MVLEWGTISIYADFELRHLSVSALKNLQRKYDNFLFSSFFNIQIKKNKKIVDIKFFVVNIFYTFWWILI